jgi:hypothetical protein
LSPSKIISDVWWRVRSYKGVVLVMIAVNFFVEETLSKPMGTDVGAQTIVFALGLSLVQAGLSALGLLVFSSPLNETKSLRDLASQWPIALMLFIFAGLKYLLLIAAGAILLVLPAIYIAAAFFFAPMESALFPDSTESAFKLSRRILHKAPLVVILCLILSFAIPLGLSHLASEQTGTGHWPISFVGASYGVWIQGVVIAIFLELRPRVSL